MATDTLPAIGFFDKHRAKIAFSGPDECWLWTSGKTSKGYGLIWGRGKNLKAHREAYEAEHGSGTADGLVVRHKCDTPECVNPAHLELGTHVDNVRDKVERGRQAKGEANGNAKLTEDAVRTIRATYVFRHPEFGGRALAQRFSVSSQIISHVVCRRRWNDIA